jgi:hypothetical protein
MIPRQIEEIVEEYRIQYPVDRIPIIDNKFNEFMSKVFEEHRKILNIIGDSTNIIRLRTNPMEYSIQLYESDNAMYRVRFENFIKRVVYMAEETKCLNIELLITKIGCH